VRTPPHNEEAEMAVLGAVMLSAKAAERVAARVEPKHFYLPVHQTIWEAVQSLVRSAKPVDLVTMRDALLAKKKLDDIGGVGYLVRLVDDVPSAESAGDYADIVLARYARRELIGRAEALAESAYRGQDLEPLLMTASEMTQGLYFGITPVVDACDVLGELKNRPGVTSLSTGIPFIDGICKGGGLYRGEMNVLGGETGSGKTLLGTQIAAHDIRQGRRVLFVSLEMTAPQLVARLVQQMTGYRSEYDARQAGDLASWEEGVGEIYRAGMPIYDSSLSSNPTVEEILGWLYDEHDKAPVDRVVLDYVQKLRLAAPGKSEHYDVHRQISEKLRVFAKKTDCCLVALSQINTEDRGGFTVRGSKEYQMDAAFLAGLVASKRSEDDRDMIVQKNRHGKKHTWETRINQVTLCLEDSLGGY
jgi:replicative DNA helicase